MLFSASVAVRACTVSFHSPTGIRHAVDLEASTLYEAAALGLARLKKDGWIEGLGPSTKLQILVREPATRHEISVDRLKRWAHGVTVSPVETLQGEGAPSSRIDEGVTCRSISA